MRPLVLSLAIHNHQPVGNFDHIFAEAADHAYLPLVAALERHPKIRPALHYSGSLLDWLIAHRPELIDRIRGLAARGQIEVMSGAYYEPILAIIPDADKRGQIDKLTRTVADLFGYAADGFWLAERVWEPHLARPLGDAGMQYTIVDDTHFHAVGLEDRQLLGYYVTEEQGVPLAIFPSLKRLRYLIPWVSVEEVIAYLRSLAETEVSTADRETPLDLALMGDDGEKFGMWPGTYDHCWQHGWMDRFFDAVESTPWLEVVPPGEYRRTRAAAGRIYLPTATYEEMAEWALPADEAGRLMRARHNLSAAQWEEIVPFVRGGFWRHFLVRYAEVNTMHRLALRAGRTITAMPAGPARARALDRLWAGQCNCPYWHGVFGGVYLPHVRGAAFANLIAAESTAESTQHVGAYARGDISDLDGDGRAEVRLATDTQVVTVDPSRGGSVTEWDYRPVPRHLGNVLTRRPEAYHAELRRAAGASTGADGGQLESIHTTTVRVKEPGLERFLIYDRQRRVSHRFHLLPAGTALEQVWRDEQDDLGGFAAGAYRWELSQAPEALTLRLSREAPVGDGTAVVERRLELAAGQHTFAHAIRLRWQGPEPLRALVALEWGLGVFGARGDVCAEAGGQRLLLHDVGDLPAAGRITVAEGHSGLQLAFIPSIAAATWSFPLVTVSNSEAGYERTDQGAVLILRWPVELAPGQIWEQTTQSEITGLGVKS